ncbi:hypothetical protein K504DRAFT_531591 [Pleomassaria siparia CBS 279.74]|uniref:Uncharacterized protein n=1 Tax=Pleomassaria siparia CBS 279.74 TaxID=1314801 RepID=A0A6G1KIY5_9PLEO|nr:hypothetical protein K504DRAFT_531591 [Pleomassaria siparia CBS 279.74]
MGHLLPVSDKPTPFLEEVKGTVRTPPILALPLELRELIYKEVLSDPSQGPQLLRACREIYTEANKFLFQRPMLFRGQTALYRWLDQAPEIYLRHVTEIVLELHDVDLRTLLVPISGSVTVNSMPRPTPWELHEKELARLEEALQKLKNIKSFTLRALPERQSFFYREFMIKVLESMGSLYPTLSSLALEGNFHHQSLSFLSSFAELDSFSFDGSSSSSPTETANILSKLTRLTNLSLVSQHALLAPEMHQHSSITSNPQSLTTPVLVAMKQLDSLSFTEPAHANTIPSLFFTAEVLASLRDHSTLNSLSIRTSHAPDTEALEAFEDFLNSASGIETLELDWPGLEPGMLERHALLPEKIKDLWVRCEDVGKAFDIMWTVMESIEAGDLKSINRLVLIRAANVAGPRKDDNEPATDDSDEMNFARLKRNLHSLGVHTYWCTQSS